MTLYTDHIGIDIAKDHLDIFSIARNKGWRIDNQRASIRAVLRRLPRECLFVFEATSVYDRDLRHVLARAGRPFARLNPRRAREFARATGLLAKTDRVDARMLARFGATLGPAPTPEATAERQRLAALLQRRNQLVEMRKQEKTRLKQAALALLRRDIIRLIGSLSRHIDKFDRAIRDLIKATAELQRLDRILQTAPGVGPFTAATLIAEAPELGTVHRRAIAMLAGLAPIADDTGKRKGYRKIKGGRPRLRRALYLAALAAKRSPEFRPFYEKLRDKGKQPKTAIIAIARKLLTTLNAMIRDQKSFRSIQA
jgi:transposase